MPAYINETDIPAVVDLLSKLHHLDPSAIPGDLGPDEIALISNHRRKALVDALENKGINIRATPTVVEGVS